MNAVNRPIHLESLLCSLLVVGALLLNGCGSRSEAVSSTTSIVAKVNGEEIAVRQLDSMFADLQGLEQKQIESAMNSVLETRIDQYLLAQRAESGGLQSSPEVVEALDNARREVLSRAYIDQIRGGVPKPSSDEVNAYYSSHPELFSSRRIYNIQELRLGPDQLPFAKKLVGERKPISQIAKDAENSKLTFSLNSGIRPAEQMPFAMASTLSDTRDGDTVVIGMPTAVAIVHVVSSEKQPISEEAASLGIQQFLIKQKESDAISREVAALRDSASIQRLANTLVKGPETSPEVAEVPASTAYRRVDRAAMMGPQDIAKGLAGL